MCIVCDHLILKKIVLACQHCIPVMILKRMRNISVPYQDQNEMMENISIPKL